MLLKKQILHTQTNLYKSIEPFTVPILETNNFNPLKKGFKRLFVRQFSNYGIKYWPILPKFNIDDFATLGAIQIEYSNTLLDFNKLDQSFLKERNPDLLNTLVIIRDYLKGTVALMQELGDLPQEERVGVILSDKLRGRIFNYFFMYELTVFNHVYPTIYNDVFWQHLDKEMNSGYKYSQLSADYIRYWVFCKELQCVLHRCSGLQLKYTLIYLDKELYTLTLNGLKCVPKYPLFSPFLKNRKMGEVLENIPLRDMYYFLVGLLYFHNNRYSEQREQYNQVRNTYY